MAKEVLKEISIRMQKTKYYSVSVDSTPDEGHIDQLTVVVRYLEGIRPVERFLTLIPNSVAQIQSWSCSLGLVLEFLQDQDQEQDRVFLARPRPRLTVQDLSKNKT